MTSTRTYGTYMYEPANGRVRGRWGLKLEPAVAVRAKRIFTRVDHDRSGLLIITDADDVARDIEWLMERYPLVPASPESEQQLRLRADAHRETMAAVARVTAGTGQRLDLPAQPAKTPRDYQLAAVELLRARGRLLLTDDLGLGKTFTGLLNLVHADALPALIVPPTHLPRRWMTELEEALPWLTVSLAAKTTPSAAFLDGDRPDVLIVPYSRLDGWRDHLEGWAASVVFDEVQELRRGVSTNKGKAAAQVSKDAAFVLGLTATPVYNYAGEIWELFNIIAPGVLGSQYEFIREWVGRWHQQHMVVSNPAALGSYLREEGVMLGRSRAEVGRELPKTVKVPQLVDADPAALERVAGDAQALARLILNDAANRTDRWRASGELDWKLREATGIGKAPYVAEFVKMILQSEQKVVLFGWHRAVYDIWLEALAAYEPVMYTGSESPAQKAAAEESFINGRARVLIMSLRSGAGVDGLQKATNVVVFGELDWSPQVHEQAIGRVRRDGMGEAPPVAYFLHATEGSDPTILETLNVKRQQSEPITTPDGKLRADATTDTNRARALAQQILGIAERRGEDEGVRL
ncbi:DEAD/DEAH box helicase [Microbacterium sp. SORGH_AS_0862]|uniref:SNF2-related protein n=1 Tax=Microbacterium sp. SORGH_AS_0862 TaxID=3041789 RepID=UPI00278F5FF1|nr:DEAD/DEAH box helicase [Microbacterium sp. SORGH_AS_0862]MDQ1206187.1 SNF2 family DNA or RNA helicase [Microbacterium sp. SORGH_AS_0862]